MCVHLKEFKQVVLIAKAGWAENELETAISLDCRNPARMYSPGLRTVGQKIGWRCRLISSPLRALPGFLIIGAMKSGTSSLFHYLRQHPQLVPAKKKEVHYFDGGGLAHAENREKSLNWYRSHFPLQRMMPNNSMTYEATPMYICHRSAAKRIYDVKSNMKLILMLRNPTERAIAHYFHSKSNRSDAELLHATMEEEIARLSSALPRASESLETLDYTSYVSRGLYQKQIENYLTYFDRGSIFIINSEEFFDDPRTIFPGLFEFLNIQTDSIINDLTARNVSQRPKHAWSRTRELLDNFFRPHNEELFEFLGKKYDWNEARS